MMTVKVERVVQAAVASLLVIVRVHIARTKTPVRQFNVDARGRCKHDAIETGCGSIS